MEFAFFLFFSIFLIISSYIVISCQNPVICVLYLILSFCNASAILILVEADFLALLFLIVYVGAIAVLFLFVVMMLNLKDSVFTTNSFFNYSLIVSTTTLFLFILVSFFFNFELISNINNAFYFPFLKSSFSWLMCLDSIDTINSISQVLYSYYFFFFLVSGFILLVAMIGAISLTAKKNLNIKKALKKQLVFQQLARNSQAAVFLVKRK